MTNGSGPQPARRPSSSPGADPDRDPNVPPVADDLLNEGSSESEPETSDSLAERRLEAERQRREDRERLRRERQEERRRTRETYLLQRDELRTQNEKDLPSEIERETERLDEFRDDAETPELLENVRNSWNRPEIYRNRNEYRINPLDWTNAVITSEAGLKRIYMDFQKLGLLEENGEFYETMFYILKNGVEYAEGAPGDEAEWFRNPYNHLGNIRDIRPTPDFVGGRAYATALAHLQEVRGLLDKHEDFERSITGAQEEIQSGGSVQRGVDTVKDAISANWNKFTESLNNGDYATAGLYVLGMFAVFKGGSAVYGRMQEKDSTFLFWGPAIAAAGYLFSKNAGYDLLEMAGAGGIDTGITPFEFMDEFVQNNPDLGVGEIDHNLIFGLESREFTLEYLHDEFLISEDPSSDRLENFIPPERFRGIAPSRISSIRQADQQEYLRIGRQLYNIAFTFRQMYNENLKTSEGFYKDMDYEEAIGRPDGIRMPSDLMAGMTPYSRRAAELLEAREINRVQDEINSRFRRAGAGSVFAINVMAQRDQNEFTGTMMGVPVMIQRDGNSYRVEVSEGDGNFDGNPINFDNVDEQGWLSNFEADWYGRVRGRINTFLRAEGIHVADNEDIVYGRGGIWVAKAEDRRLRVFVKFDDDGNVEELRRSQEGAEEGEDLDTEAEPTTPAESLDLTTLPSSPDEVNPENLEEVRTLVEKARDQIKSDESLTQAQKNDYTRRLGRLDARILMIDASQKIEALMKDIDNDASNLNLSVHEEEAKKIRDLFERAVGLGEDRESMGVLSDLIFLENRIFNLKMDDMLRASNTNWKLEHGYFRRFDEVYIRRAISETLVRLGIPSTSRVVVSSRLGKVRISITGITDRDGNPIDNVSVEGVYSSIRDVAIKSALIALENRMIQEEDVNKMLESGMNNWDWEVTEHDPARRLLAQALVRKGYPLDSNVRIIQKRFSANNKKIILEINGQSYEGSEGGIIYEDLDMFQAGRFRYVRAGRSNLMRALSDAIVKIPRYER